MLPGIPQESMHLYLDEQSLKVAKVITRNHEKTVAGIFYQKIEGLSAEDILRTLLDAKQILGLRSKNVRLVISSRRIITKSIEVPSLDPIEISDIIRLQAGRHTPFSKEEIIVGHINLEVILERYMKSLIAIVPNDTIRVATNTLDIGGFQIESICLIPELLSYALVKEKNLDDASPPQALIHVDQDYSDLVIIRQKKTFFVRNIPIGAKQLAASKDAQQRFVDEITKSIDAYQNDESESPPEDFYIAGVETNAVQALKSSLEASLKKKIEPVFGPDSMCLSPAAADEIKRHKDVSFLDVIFEGAYGELCLIDLLPQDLKIRRNFRRRGQEIFVGGICLLIIFILTMGTSMTRIYFSTLYFTELESQFEERSIEVDDLIFLSDQTRAIREFKSQKGKAMRVLNELATLLPSEMYLKEVILEDSDGKFTITGTSGLMSTVFSFVTDFENSPYFQNVTTDYTKSRKEGKLDVADFGISASIEENLEPTG